MDQQVNHGFPVGGGETGARTRAHDWASTPLGPIGQWPASLRVAVGLVLDSPEPMYLAWGPELIVFHNDACRPILGPRAAHALGAPIRQLWPDAWEQMRPMAEQALAGRSSRLDDLSVAMARHGEPEQTWWSFSYSPVRDESGAVAGLFCIANETTARIAAQRQLAGERERLSRMFEQAPTIMAMLEGPAHRITLANAEYLRLLDHRPVVGLTVAEALPDAAGQGLVTLLDAVYRSGVAHTGRRISHQVAARPGEPATERVIEFVHQPILDAARQVVGIFVVGVDITERTGSERRLREQETRNRQILDSAIDDAVVATDREGRVTRWSEGARRTLGWTEQEMLGQPLDRIFTEDDVASGRVQAERQGAIANGRGNDERWHLRRDGERFWAVGEMTCLEDESGRIVGFVKVLRDRTETLRAGEAERAALVRSSFLLDLENELRTLSGASELLNAAAERLGRHLKAGQVGYSDIDEPVMHCTIAHEWSDGTIPSTMGVHRIDDFGEGFARDLRQGRTIVVDDVRTDPRTASPASIASFERLRIRALLNIPLVRHGKVLAQMVVHSADPRGWARDEVGLARDVAERIWAAAVRARSKAALRDEQRSLETLNRTGSALAGELDLERVVQMVTDAGVSLTGARFGAFFYNVLDPAGGGYMLYTLSGVDRAAFERFPMPRKTSIFAPTFDGDGLIRSDDILADPRYGRNAPHSGMPDGHLPVRSYLAVPVVSRSGEVIGGLFFGHPGTGRFSARHETLMVAIAAQASIAIDNARLFKAAQHELEERRRAETELQELNDTLETRIAAAIAAREAALEALRQSQKMEAVGQLTGGLAHDFNNLLTGITGSLELMQTRIGQGRVQEIDRYVTAAQGAARRAAALTHRLLAFSRRQTLAPKPTDVQRLVTGMQELIERTTGPEITVETLTEGDLWTTLVDPSQLENALLNLCINARDAMPGGGRLTIETGNRRLDEPRARDHDVPPGQYVSLRVSDDGAGMTPDVVSRAFDPFFTTKPIGLGTGLGLSMIYGFARQSGGQARIDSEPGRGTTVCLYLPRHVGEAETAEPQPEPGRAPRAGSGETVLVVDDEPTVRMLVTEVLEDLGYTALEAADGAAGLAILQSDVRIDLLVTDVGLPGGMNGRQVADAARIARPGLKVLFITGYAETTVLSHGHLDPGMHILTKPFAMEILAARIRDLIASAS